MCVRVKSVQNDYQKCHLNIKRITIYGQSHKILYDLKKDFICLSMYVSMVRFE